MLRWSVEESNRRIEMRALADRAADPLLPGAADLLDLVDAVMVGAGDRERAAAAVADRFGDTGPVSYTHLRAHET